METYVYALVQAGHVGREYNYISDDPAIKVGSYVAVPFGLDDDEWAGVVTNLFTCTAEDAPFPVEKDVAFPAGDFQRGV